MRKNISREHQQGAQNTASAGSSEIIAPSVPYTPASFSNDQLAQITQIVLVNINHMEYMKNDSLNT